MNLKLFDNHGAIHGFEKKFKKYSGKINPLGVLSNMSGCIIEVNSEGLGWLRHSSSKKMDQQKMEVLILK